ncbi:hypothetical protein MKW92_028214 [Papaver armeniacum]|nr:hypothetical protein MKW92_028214 [Papaver armeniacum]
MSIPYTTSTSASRPAFQIYRDFRNKYEEDNFGDGNIYPNQTLQSVRIDDEPAAPYIILVQGPPKVGKSLLIKSLIKYFNKEQHIMNDIRGPITVITGKKTRLQFVECPDEINAMIDAAKYADAVLLLVDASYGFEAETFEFLNLLQVHGFPKVMGVLTHLDELKGKKQLKETKNRLQDHFQTEIYQPATVYNLSGLGHDGLYKMGEVQKLAEDISMLQSIPLSWRAAHPYVLVDRFEDITPLDEVHKDANCKRNISLYGYLRGCNIKSGAKNRDLCKVDVRNVPFRMVDNFNPCHPILVGGISLEEENVGYMQAKFKRHEWHMKLLKSKDPITVSAGWRRYQTKPIYAMESDDIRLLKFTPEHNHCLAMFWGPLAPPLTRIAVVQSNKEAFRIAAKAIVLDPKPGMKIMKESKQKGTPLKLSKKRTALVNFTPETKVSMYKGAPIRTLSGIRGKINEAAKREGIAKCTFKCRISMSDIVFMRVWRQVEVPRFFNPSTTLEPCDSIVPVNKDSLNKDDPDQRRVELKQRRRVKIIDGEPCLYTCSNPLTIRYNLNNKNKERKIKKKKNEVISEEEQKAYERGAEMSKRHREEDEKAFTSGVPMMVLEDWD